MLNLLEPLREAPEEILEKYKTPQCSDDYYRLGIAYDQLGNKPHAEQMFRRALQRDITHLPSLLGLAFKAFQSGKESLGKNWLSRAIRLDSDAETHILEFQRELKKAIPHSPRTVEYREFCFQALQDAKKDGETSRFEWAKLLFEQSKFESAIPIFRALLGQSSYVEEAAEFLSFALENLYKGDALLEQAFQLLPEIEHKSDLFFNLAMVCQHEQRRMDLALHFFHLASTHDSYDPGLRFSLEQAAMDVITDSKKQKNTDQTLLMFAHLYQGSVGVAKEYAKSLTSEMVSRSMPSKLWNDWLIKDSGTLGSSLRAWFE